MAIRFFAAAAVAALSLVACSSTSRDRFASSGEVSTGLPACTSLRAASSGQCSAARAYLNCTNGGVTELCLSDDPARCPDAVMASGGARAADGAVTSGAGALTCTDRCAPDEYGAVCGAGGAGPGANCRSMGITPGGTEFFCCPCGSADAAWVDAGAPVCPFAPDAALIETSTPSPQSPDAALVFTTDGPCDTGALCAFQTPVSALGWQNYSCQCVSGAWACTNVGGGL